MRRISAFIFTAVLLFGCGGGSPVQDVQTIHNYSRPAYRSPNYFPHLSGSHVYRWGDTIYVGGDVEPRERLRRIGTAGDITYSMGASRDGVGVDRLKNYEEDLITEDGTVSGYLSSNGFYPFRVRPVISLSREFFIPFAEGDPAAIAAFDVLADSINIINDALPPEFQIGFALPTDTDLTYPNEGSITIGILPESEVSEICEGGVACSLSRLNHTDVKTHLSLITFPDTLGSMGYSEARTLVIHELLHALGIQGHVDSIEFPDSIMGKYGDFFPNPGFTIHRIDREILQILYMSQRTAQYNDWGEWSDTSLHLVGESEDGHVNFGVALFNGLPQPWARGTMPGRGLSEASYLRGSVTWEGALLAFSGPSPVVGDTALTVHMDRLDEDQDLRFRDLYFFNRSESEGNDSVVPHPEYRLQGDIG